MQFIDLKFRHQLIGDKFNARIQKVMEYAHFACKRSVEIDNTYDLILVSTDHAEYKTFDFSSYSCPLVDCRNCIQHKPKKYYQA